MADGTSGARGFTYEYRKCMLCVVRGYTRGLENFQLRYQVPESEAGKFDDVVFDENGGSKVFFQLKHKERGQNKISSSQLFNKEFKDHYNLLKYVKSVIDINSNNTSDSEMRMAVVFTPIDFVFKKNSKELSLKWNRNVWCKGFTEIQLDFFKPDKNEIYSFTNAKYYQFDKDPNIVQILKRQAEILSQELREKMQKNFEPQYENRPKRLKHNEKAVADFLEALTEDEIRKALPFIIYAVRQPNDKELEEIIKNEIKVFFKLQDVTTVYNAFEKEITNWCNMKDPFDGQTFVNPHIIQFDNADIFFQKHVKNLFFCENTPTSCFTGRTDELKWIRENLKVKLDFVFSQSIAISGLGGIGKTELVKQFIKEFGQSDFYGRIIWIEAESDESVKKSFISLAEKIDIQNRANKTIKTVIDQIFVYFHGLKVLFVFDNFDNNTDDAATYSDDEEKNLVNYCRKRASDPTKKHRPYFILTSRQRKCSPGVPSLHLDVLKEEDANFLIIKGLIAKNYTNHDVEELAKNLQYFPLALQQAIAYINKQYEIKRVSGGRYEIQNYLKEFVEKRKNLLSYPHTSDFGERLEERTTWITWNVTFDAIRKDEKYGPDAIKVLQFMSYLYADKIDAKIFLALFKSDLTRNGEAFLLLEKYSIITNIAESSFYQIHRLVQAVVQLKFKEKESDTLKQIWELIFPKLYESYFNDDKSWSKLIDECTIDQILHYNSLANYIKNYKRLNKKFEYFLDFLNGKVLLDAFDEDDVDKIKKLHLSPEALKKFAKRNINFKQTIYSGKVVKYFIEKGYLELNEETLICTIENGNFDMFKFMVEKGANLKELKLVSIDLIRDVIQGKLNSLLVYVYIQNKETEENRRVLKESLFFASLFNHESIVELLIYNKVAPDYEFHKCNYSPIKAAFQLNYPHILKILLKAFDKPEDKDNVAKILFELLHDETLYINKNCFEVTFKKYLELGGDINDQHGFSKNSTFITKATEPSLFEVWKIVIVNFFLDNGADPFIISDEGNNALFNVIIKINDPEYIHDLDKDLFNDIFRKMRSKISIETFTSSIIDRFCKRNQCNANEKTFDDIYQYAKNINFRNEKGETLLIYVIRSLNTKVAEENTILLLLETGVDVDAKDNNCKDALFYSLDLKSPEIFKLLITKVSSVSEEILLKAIQNDKFRCLKELLKFHFKLRHRFEDNKTLIEVAFESLSLKVMLFLHPKIKELNLKNGEFQRINKKAQLAFIKYLENCSQNGDNVNFGDLDALLKISGDVNAIDENGNNALHYATDLEDIRPFMYLLNKGSKVLEKTFEHAIKHDKLKIVQMIIPNYFKKDHRFTNGSTPTAINLAAEFRARKVYTFLTGLTFIFSIV